jgi:2-C-methyl-D-erythritol 4-phosphate cytidylyltransferase
MQASEHPSPTPGGIAAILPAAGSGERFGADRNKLFANLAGKPLWFHAASRLAARKEVGRIVLAISETDRGAFTGEFAPLVEQLGIELVAGGAARTDSVRAGLEAIADDSSIGLVAIHDAARPMVNAADLSAVFERAGKVGAAILATPVSGTIKRDLERGERSETVDRRDLWIALTPQVFRVGLLKQAYQKHNGRPATDDAQLVERIGHAVSLVRGSADNLKITYPEDLLVAEAILARQANHA